MAEHWIQDARKKMEKKGSVGKFGRATAKKIAAGKRAGGERAKEATFASNMKKIAAKRHKHGRKKGRSGGR